MAPLGSSSDGGEIVELNALLGRGTSYAGKLFFEGRIRIEGRFNGEIRGDDILVIGDGAEVEGDIRVGVCIVTGGRVTANIQARRAIELHVPAVVRGDLHAPAIFIDRGVQYEGSCKMAPLDETPVPPAPRELPRPSPPPLRRASTTAPTATEPGAPALGGAAEVARSGDEADPSQGDRHTPVGGWRAPSAGSPGRDGPGEEGKPGRGPR